MAPNEVLLSMSALPTESKSSKGSVGGTRLQAGDEYGVLSNPNIGLVVFGDYVFQTWYGNGAYFASSGDQELGIDTMKLNALLLRRKTPQASSDGIWLAQLYVCEHCFKYSSDAQKMTLHRTLCPLKKPFPPLGKLVYSDTRAPYLIKQVRGYTHELFCQNLSLFGKLFLEDKSVYYNVECFEFYILYGFDPEDEEISGSVLRKYFKPMGFFSREINSWDADNNLACICIFPPYQRLHLGQLLIEFLYALASVTPHMARLGPEYPLSPYGRISYLRFWAKKLASVISTDYATKDKVTLVQLGNATGFRKEDILLALEYMEILEEDPENGKVFLKVANVQEWCRKNHFDSTIHQQKLNPDCLLL